MMKLFRYKISNLLPAALLLCTTGTTFAQTQETLDAYRKKYPGQHIVLKKNEIRISIRLVKDVPVVTHHYAIEHLILDKNAAVRLSDGNVEFSSFEEVGPIEAYSMIPAGKTSKKIAATDFRTVKAETSGSVFHDDSQETQFLYPGLCEGAMRSLSYDITMKDHHFPFGFTFNAYVPTENPTFIIECDTAIHLKTLLMNISESDVVYSERVEKNKRILTWNMPYAAPMKDEEMAPGYRYYWPHVLAQIDYYTSKKGRVNVLGSADDLHTYYQPNVAEVIAEQPSPELKAIAESVTKDISSDLEKVKAVYYWVQDNIKYIAFEEGMGGYVPRQPSQVISKRYGDCKDMASVIYSMLKSINVTSYLTWIGSRELPYRYTDFPSGSCDNHMIAVYRENDRLYFLDATTSLQPFDMPTEFIQGKQGLMHTGDGKFEIVEVPVMEASRTFMTDTTRITLDGRNVAGSAHTVIGGYYHTDLGIYLKDVPAKETDKAVGSIAEKGNNSYVVSNAKMQHLAERDVPMTVDCDFKVSNYATTFDNELYVNLVLEKNVVQIGEMKPDRMAPIDMGRRTSDSYTVILDVPAGYKVKSLPKGGTFKNEYVDYSVVYQQQGNQVTMTLKLKLDFLLLPKTAFDSWNEFIRIKKASTSESVVLIKQ